MKAHALCAGHLCTVVYKVFFFTEWRITIQQRGGHRRCPTTSTSQELGHAFLCSMKLIETTQAHSFHAKESYTISGGGRSGGRSGGSREVGREIGRGVGREEVGSKSRGAPKCSKSEQALWGLLISSCQHRTPPVEASESLIAVPPSQRFQIWWNTQGTGQDRVPPSRSAGHEMDSRGLQLPIEILNAPTKTRFLMVA